MSAGFKKPFGLQIRKAASKPILKKSAFCADDHDEESFDENLSAEALDRKNVNAILSKANKHAQTKRSNQTKIQKALEQDEKIFEYDKIYDDVSSIKQAEREDEERKKLNQTNKAPKYIKNLLKTAAKRNLESERRYERRSVKERKTEDDMFGDKEKFLTPAYKEKMLKLEEAEQEQLRRDKLDEMQDVTKQNDMSGFYRHFLQDNYSKPREFINKTNAEIEAEKLKKEAKQPENQTSVENDTSVIPTRQRHDSSSDEEPSQEDADSTAGDDGMSDQFDMSNDQFKASSTTFSKSSMRSRITAGGAGIETEIDYEEQVEKLKVIFKRKITDDDVAEQARLYFQRQAVRDGQGGWAKVLKNRS